MSNFKMQLLYNIAYDYYINKAKQKEIAAKFKINRVQVSKYLKEAEELGMVKIKVVNPYEDTTRDLEKALQTKFSINKAKVVSISSTDFETMHNELITGAVDYLNETLTPIDMIGVGWGKTIFKLAKNFKTDNNYPDIEFIPIMAGKPDFDREFQSSNICFMLAEKFNGKSHSLLAPYFIPVKEEYNAFINNEDVKTTTCKWKAINKMIIGIGSNFSQNPLIKLYGLPKEDIEKLIEFKHVGDIAAHYYNDKGEFCDLNIYNSLINIPLKELSNKQIIAIAAGLEKKEAIKGALRTGLIDTIILDDRTAKQIIEDK